VLSGFASHRKILPVTRKASFSPVKTFRSPVYEYTAPKKTRALPLPRCVFAQQDKWTSNLPAAQGGFSTEPPSPRKRKVTVGAKASRVAKLSPCEIIGIHRSHPCTTIPVVNRIREKIFRENMDWKIRLGSAVWIGVLEAISSAVESGVKNGNQRTPVRISIVS
jgi:hypothetical protein